MMMQLKGKKRKSKKKKNVALSYSQLLLSNKQRKLKAFLQKIFLYHNSIKRQSFFHNLTINFLKGRHGLFFTV